MTARLRTLIVDDEPVARELLVSLLAPDERIEVVGQCGDGDTALAAIRRLRPDLVLLDVSMPGKSGLDVALELGEDEPAAIIFVTAHDDYAVQAFEVRALDYLLKPVQEERLAAALERVISARGSDEQGEPDGPESWLVVRQGDKRVPLRWEEIVWIESAGNYARVHVAGAQYLLRSSLRELEERLHGLPFARIHRQALVNVSRIISLRPVGHGDYRVRVAGDRELPLSRRHRPALERLLGRLG